MQYYTNYSSSKYSSGTVISTRNSGELEILGKTEGKKFWVRFLLTGYEREASMSGLSQKSVRDPYYPSVYGRGYLGRGEYSRGSHPREYNAWNAMLCRCYSELDKHSTYRGVEVATEWLNFQKFCEDLPKLQNYSLWLANKEEYALDKDSINPKARYYSVGTCKFLTKVDNSKERYNRHAIHTS